MERPVRFQGSDGCGLAAARTGQREYPQQAGGPPRTVRAHRHERASRGLGFRARRLEGGFMEWRRAGLPLVRGDTPARLAI